VQALAQLDRRSNVVVLRTFSKAYGLAGLRVGYGIGPAALIAALSAIRTTYSVSALAESAALAALEDEPSLYRTLENNQRGVSHLEKGLSALGIPFSPTCANFIFVSVPGAAADLATRLYSRGILVKPLADWGSPGAIRVTVGTPVQNERFLISLASELRGTPLHRDLPDSR
jgi:histidinol-phosphate aminotransferase